MKKQEKIDEESLVKMLYARDEASIGILYDQYSPAVYGVILRIIGNTELAEGILKETFLNIWTNFQQYDASKGRLLTWIINVARNKTLERMRSGSMETQIKNIFQNDYVLMLDNVSAISVNTESIALPELIKQLGLEYKMIIDQMYFQGMNQFQAADKLNIPLGTVKNRLRAAIQKLHDLYKNDSSR